MESPLAEGQGRTVEQNQQLARNICRHACLTGYNPIASHLFYTQFLDDLVGSERLIGIECGLAWGEHADESWFVLPEGLNMSRGMLMGLNNAIEAGRKTRFFRTSDEAVHTFREVTMFQGAANES